MVEGMKEEWVREVEGEMVVKKLGEKVFSICFRRNWKKRYFALRGKTLLYYSDSDLSTAKPNGAIDLSDVQ